MNTIGSSDVASILGLSKWSSPMQTWARLTGLVARYDDTQTAATTRGSRMEAALRNWRAEELGVTVRPGPVIGRDPVWAAAAPYEWAHARPDGDYDAADGIVLTECKTVRRFEDDEWGAPGTADVPAYYYAQALWQMGVARLGGRNVVRCDLVAFSPMSEDYRVYVIPYDDVRFRALLARVGAWRERHVLGGEPPPVDGHEATTDILTRIYPGGIERKLIDATDADTQTATRLAAVKAQIARLEEEERALGNLLRDRIGREGATEITGVARWTPCKGKTGFDAKALEADMPDVYRRYVKLGAPYRTLTLTIKNNEE